MTAILNGGAIPEVFDYRVLLEPEGHFIGTLNEDFAIESLPGDVFQLGNTSWRILRIGNGVVRVADAQGQPPSMPFWLGEAPARSDEMSAAVSRLRAAVDAMLPGPDAPRISGELEPRSPRSDRVRLSAGRRADRRATSPRRKRALGVVPTIDTIALERFFDESGGMQLVLHAPFGSRINRAWGLALRKKFCQGFNFELQAAATEEGIILSLGAAHSFPLEEVFRYLHPNTVRETLMQAVLDSPIFETRWRWTTTLALAVPRNRDGARVPNQLQRMYAEDLLQAVFPDAVACQDNLQGAREIPTIRWSNQALRDCLEEAMDLPALETILQTALRRAKSIASRATRPSLRCSATSCSTPRCTPSSTMRRSRSAARAPSTRAAPPRCAAPTISARSTRRRSSACARKRGRSPTRADEMYDALMVAGYLEERELESHWRFTDREHFDQRAVYARTGVGSRSSASTTIRIELLASRLEVLGPIQAR